ncbi:putative VQ motif-containing protein [Melia azedarach]|uniref:VQ motif-containing protein n=1 Tax=Melia azedarach TaxID=155640 RepID=A0ACC1X336_MELAZ|nr:putative VQ motif-containing protein [Melia azedarach]
MEDIIKKPTSYNNIPPSTLSMHKNSHTIAKPKPKIRIIHIFAPEIIKTDVENFRELVQRLTGKPTDHQQHQKSGRMKPRNPRREEEYSRSTSAVQQEKQVLAKKVELRSTVLGLETRDQRVKEEEEEEEEQQQQQILWNGANSGGFLNGFADFDGFIQELGEFPLLPMDSSHHLHGFEGTQYA